MQINIDDNKYKVKVEHIDSEKYQYVVIPKVRNCKLCKKGFESTGSEHINWTDDNGYARTGYFCKSCMCLVRRALKLIKDKR